MVKVNILHTTLNHDSNPINCSACIRSTSWNAQQFDRPLSLNSFFWCLFSIALLSNFMWNFRERKTNFNNIFQIWIFSNYDVWKFFLMDKPPAQAVTGAFTSFQSFSNKASRSSFHSIELLAFKSHKTVRAFEELRSVRFSITKWKRAQRHTQMKLIERRQQQDKSVNGTPELGNNLLGVSFNFYCRHCLVYFYFTSVKMIC